MVGTASRQLLHIRRQQNSCDVFLVRGEVGQGHKLGTVVGLDELPDKYVSLHGISNGLGSKAKQIERKPYSIVRCTEECSIAGDGDAGHGNLFLRNKLVRAGVLGQIPEPDTSCTVAADDFPLIRMDHNISRW